MTQDDISMQEAKRIARANGYRAGKPLSEFQIISMVSAGFAAGLKAATMKADKMTLSE